MGSCKPATVGHHHGADALARLTSYSGQFAPPLREAGHRTGTLIYTSVVASAKSALFMAQGAVQKTG